MREGERKMPTSAMVWAGIYAFATSFFLTLSSHLVQLHDTNEHIALSTWGIILCGCGSSAFVAARAAKVNSKG